jgi:hypothetical protein
MRRFANPLTRAPEYRLTAARWHVIDNDKTAAGPDARIWLCRSPRRDIGTVDGGWVYRQRPFRSHCGLIATPPWCRLGYRWQML